MLLQSFHENRPAPLVTFPHYNGWICHDALKSPIITATIQPIYYWLSLFVFNIDAIDRTHPMGMHIAVMQCKCPLTHWGRVTHICVSKLTIIGSDNGLSPDRRQAIIWTNAGLLLIGPVGKKLQWNLKRNSNIFIEENAFEGVVCETAAILSRPQCVNDKNDTDLTCKHDSLRHSRHYIFNNTINHDIAIFFRIDKIWGWRHVFPWHAVLRNIA